MKVAAFRWASPVGATNRAKNASPPRRARSSPASPTRRSRPATMDSTASPAPRPQAWLMALKRSRSRRTTAIDPDSDSRPMTRVRCSSNWSRVGRPVKGSPTGPTQVTGGAISAGSRRRRNAATRSSTPLLPEPSAKTRASTAIRCPVPLSNSKIRERVCRAPAVLPTTENTCAVPPKPARPPESTVSSNRWPTTSSRRHPKE